MRCPRCGAQLELDERICKICGEKLEDDLLETLEILQEMDDEELQHKEGENESSYTHKREVILNSVAFIITIILAGLIFLPLFIAR